MKVALCQIEVVASDREGAFRRIGEALETAVRDGAELAVFPESALLGWINPQAHQLAQPIPGADSDRLCAMAADWRIGLILGLEEKHGDDLFGAALAISPTGEVLAHHRKVNVLAELMDPPYTAGSDGQATFAEFPFGRVAVLICADCFHPKLVAAVRSGAPDLLVVPFGWVAPTSDISSHGEKLIDLVSSLAKQVNCPVVGVDAVGVVLEGPWEGRRLCGASNAADRSGRLLSEARFGRKFVQVVQVY